LNPPAVYTSDDDATADAPANNLKQLDVQDDDDNTEITEEESHSTQFDAEPKVAGPKMPQLFPANSARYVTSPSTKKTSSSSIGKKILVGKSMQTQKPKRGSRTSATSLLGISRNSGHKDGDNSGSGSGSGSGAED
jgi:hypothetical protein